MSSDTKSIGSSDPGAPRLRLPVSELMIAVDVNGQQATDFAVVLQEGDHFSVTAQDLASWRLKRPSVPPQIWKGDDYYALDSIPGMTTQLDSASQVLHVHVPAIAFTTSLADVHDQKRLPVDASDPGFFLNHDFQYLETSGSQAVTGSVEAGLFSKAGVITSRMIGRNLLQSLKWTRVDTQFTRDFPDSLASLTVGDSISAANPWALQVYYGGVRWASKFATQPSFQALALPSANGEVTVPSTVDLYVNGAKISEQQVDPGPFAIQNVPVMSGQGNISMVVTDLLGRQQVVTQPYIMSSTVLRKGVTDYTYEAGSLRYGYGLSHSGYTSFFASGTQRYGWSDSLTLNARVELQGIGQTVGVGADRAFLHLGALGAGGALSHGPQGGGGLVYGQFVHASERFDFSAMATIDNSSFRQLGLLANERAPRITAQATVDRRLGKTVTLALGYLRREGRSHIDMPIDPTVVDLSAINSSLSWKLGKHMTLVSAINYSPGASTRTTGSFNLIIPIGSRDLAMVSSTMNKDNKTATVDYSHSLPAGPGIGYRFRGDAADNRGFDAGFYAQNSLGTYLVETAQGDTGWSTRLEETSSVLLFHGKVIPTRWLADSFALVEVPQSGIKVLANNQYFGTIGKRGFVLVPSMAPYSANSVRLDDQSVPIDLQINLEERRVVPMPRSGVFVKFAATRSTGVLLILVTEDGTPIPLGAAVTANDSAASDTVAMHGEVFVQNITLPGRATARWNKGECEAEVPAPPGNEALPRIGPLVCQAKK